MSYINKDIFANMVREEVEKLKIGNNISLNINQFKFADSEGNPKSIKQIVYLGEDPTLTAQYNMQIKNKNNNNNKIITVEPRVKIVNLLVFLENNEKIIWSLRDSDLTNYFNNTMFSSTNRQVIPVRLLQQIRLPREKESIQIVGEETPIQLPDDVKNNLLTMFGHDENTDYFIPKNGGRRKTTKVRKSRKATKSRKSKKSRKTNKLKKSIKNKKRNKKL